MAEIRDELFYRQKNGYDTMSTQQRIDMEDYCRGYMAFLNEARTEREAVKMAIEMAEAKGFVEYADGMELKAGDKVYRNNRGKSLMLAVIGKQSLEKGVMIAGAHVDSPRIDLKQNPLYESDELAYFKTHYYGGIKKYQWVTIPLELHGVVALKSGEVIDVTIGHDPADPQFVITDLLPHLGKEQMKKTMEEGITGEGLNILIGSVPYADEGSDRVKLAVMSILNDRYGIVEEDFLSAELTAVPAFEVREIGLDRSLIGGYGHDDRVCAYPALQAILSVSEPPEYTCITVLTDKEETGSDGNTGLNSSYLKYFIEDLARLEGYEGRDVLRNSKCLSADVNAAFDPTWSSAFEKNNASFINEGVVVTKFTGSHGKSGTSDASAEYVSFVKNLLEENGVLWQSGELGKVDGGGGGTVAMYIANLDVDVIDVGVPVLSMHAPYEIVAKIDVYMAYKAFTTFFTK